MQEILSKEKIGLRLRQLRLKNNYSQHTVASALGLSRSNYSQIEIGKQFPTYQVLVKLSVYYNVSYESILHGARLQNKVADELKEIVFPLPTLLSDKDRIALVQVSDYYNYLVSGKCDKYLESLADLDFSVRPEGDPSVYRAFQVKAIANGSRCLDDDIVIAQSVTGISELDYGQYYVIITRDEILLRRIVMFAEDNALFICKLDHPGMPIQSIPSRDVQELWKLWGICSTSLGQIVEQLGQGLKSLECSIQELKTKAEMLK